MGQKHKVSEDKIKQIKSINDKAMMVLAEETAPGKNPFYHAIGTMGGIAVRDKYRDIQSMKTEQAQK